MAAIVVVLYHYVEVHAERIGAHILLSNWGRDAVMVFFILSGCVINMSEKRNPKSRGAFIGNRILRIYPEFIAGFIIGLLVTLIVGDQMPSLLILIGNFFMLSTEDSFIVKTLPANAPIWSLSYEMFFYLIFALAIGRKLKKFMLLWLIIAVLMLIPFYTSHIEKNAVGHFINVIVFSTLWLIGYYVYEYRKCFHTSWLTAVLCATMLPLVSRLHIMQPFIDPIKYILFALLAVPLFRYCMEESPLGIKIKLVHVLPVYILIAVFFILTSESMFFSKLFFSIVPLGAVLIAFFIQRSRQKNDIKQKVQQFGLVAGKYSYALYISHYPVLILFATVFTNIFFYVVVSGVCIIILAWFLESIWQPAAIRIIS